MPLTLSLTLDLTLTRVTCRGQRRAARISGGSNEDFRGKRDGELLRSNVAKGSATRPRRSGPRARHGIVDVQEVVGGTLATWRRYGRVLRYHTPGYGGQLEASLVATRCGGYDDVLDTFVDGRGDGLETAQPDAGRADGEVIVGQGTEGRVLRGIAAPVLEAFQGVLQPPALRVLVVAHVRSELVVEGGPS